VAPAVIAVLDRMIFSGLTARDAFGNSHDPSEASNRAGSPLFGCKRSPQRQNPWQPQATVFNHSNDI